MKFLIILLLLVFPSRSWAGETGNFYSVQFDHCYDGDTCTFIIPWLPPPFTKIKIRVENVDTPERLWRGKCEQEKQLAEVATAATNALMRGAHSIDLLDVGPAGMYGRNPATVMIDKTINWETWLIQEGYAVYSDGKRSKDWCVK